MNVSEMVGYRNAPYSSHIYETKDLIRFDDITFCYL